MFKKAVRENVKIKMAITGPAGSGKTLSSLKLAKGLGDKIAVIDTENESASMYSHLVDFDVCPLREPYTSKKFIDAIKGAVSGGYDVVIIDSITHEWAGQGGILDRKTIKDSIGGNSFTNWRDFTKEHNEFVNAILQSDINIVCTMRSKTDYIMTENENGKSAPKKVGLAPVQREGMDYEYSIVFDIDQNHIASVSKDRTGLFDGRNFLIDESIGKEISDWKNSGKSVEKKPSIKEMLLAKVALIKDEALAAKVIAAIETEGDQIKLSSFETRIDQILLEQEGSDLEK